MDEDDKYVGERKGNHELALPCVDKPVRGKIYHGYYSSLHAVDRRREYESVDIHRESIVYETVLLVSVECTAIFETRQQAQRFYEWPDSHYVGQVCARYNGDSTR